MMLSLKWSYNQKTGGKMGGKMGDKITEGVSNRFGFEPVRYQMQTNMIGRVLNGYICGGCKK